MSDAFSAPWDVVARAVLLTAVAYGALIVLLRTCGKRTTSKLNIFDWIVTVALGSMLANLALSRDTPLLVGLAAIATLIGLQFALSWGLVRSRLLRRLVKAEPALLFYRGEFLHDRMRRERVTEEEIRSAVREKGCGDLGAIQAVILETNAELSVVRELGEATALGDVEVPAPPR